MLQELKIIPSDAYLITRAPLVQQALAVQFLDIDSIVEEDGVFVLIGVVSVGPAIANAAFLDVPCVLDSLLVDVGASKPA